MVLICSNTYPENKSQVQKFRLDSIRAAFIETLIGLGAVTRRAASAPCLAPVFLRVVTGLALGFWLVQLVKTNIG